DSLAPLDKSSMNFGSGRTKVWKDIWSAGQGVGNIDDVPPVRELVERLREEYEVARRRLQLDPAAAPALQD
ncbi:MAG: nitronate monooxygenase, partial [Burkholderiales bacterium]